MLYPNLLHLLKDEPGVQQLSRCVGFQNPKKTPRAKTTLSKNHRRWHREILLSHAATKCHSWHPTHEMQVRWDPLMLFKKDHFMLPCLSPLRSHTRGYSSPQRTGARLFAEVIDEKFILFGECLNIQSRNLTGCWAASLAVALQLRVSKVQVANSEPYSRSNKIVRNLTRISRSLCFALLCFVFRKDF